MDLKKLKQRPHLNEHKKYIQFKNLIDELDKKELPAKVAEKINAHIEFVNSIPDTDPKLGKKVKLVQTNILKLLEKELKIVTKNHYRNMWLAVGMSAFGIPLGVVFGLLMDNMGLLAIGIPIGMVIGIAYGTKLDKKAQENENQLDVEIKY